MEAELRKALESREGQSDNYEFLARVLNELMYRTGEVWWGEEIPPPSMEIAGEYLYLADRVMEYARQKLNAEDYHRFCAEARCMLF